MLRNRRSKNGPRGSDPRPQNQWRTYKGNRWGFGGFERNLLYLRAQMESGKVFGHKVIQKISGNNFKTRFQALGALSRHLRPDRDSNPTDFPILDRYYFGQVLTTIGDTVVPVRYPIRIDLLYGTVSGNKKLDLFGVT